MHVKGAHCVPEEIDPDRSTERDILEKLLDFKEKKKPFQVKGSKSLIKERKSYYS